MLLVRPDGDSEIARCGRVHAVRKVLPASSRTAYQTIPRAYIPVGAPTTTSIQTTHLTRGLHSNKESRILDAEGIVLMITGSAIPLASDVIVIPARTTLHR